MKRRDFLKVFGALGLARSTVALAKPRVYDVVVIGAGVFGVWIAAYLQRAGRRVAVIDAFGPAHSGASSGGESRVSRCGYGSEELYTEWACRSMAEWRALSERASLPLFHEMGVLWIHRKDDGLIDANIRTLAKLDIPFARFTARQLRRRFPVLDVEDDERGFLERRGGALMARRAVQQLAAELAAQGVTFITGQVSPIHRADAIDDALPYVTTKDGRLIEAERFVFACGPWLDRVCPDAMSGKLKVTRQEVVFFAVDRARTGALPVWADLPFYGLPSLEGRGFKVANDTRGEEVDVTTLDRRGTREAEAEARELLARRFPSLGGSPLNEVRVCQYENSASGDFVLDRHPGLDNVWLAGCGSGHGFKHGPAVGAHVAGLVLGTDTKNPRFSIAG